MAASSAPVMTGSSIFRRVVFGIMFISGLQSSCQPMRLAGRINSWPNDGPGLITRANSLPTGASTRIAPLPYCEINKYASLKDFSSFRPNASYLPVYNEGDDDSLSRVPSEADIRLTDSDEIALESPARPVGLALLLEPLDLLQFLDSGVSSPERDSSSSMASLSSYTQSFSSGSGQANGMAAVATPMQPAPTSASQLSLSYEESGSHMSTRTWSLHGPGQDDTASVASSVSSGLSDESDESDESVGHWDVAHAVANHGLEPVQLVPEDTHSDHLFSASMPMGTEVTLVDSSVLSISDPPSPSAAPRALAGFLGVRLKRGTWPLKPNPGAKRRLSGWVQEHLTKRARTEDRHGIDAAMMAS